VSRVADERVVAPGPREVLDVGQRVVLAGRAGAGRAAARQRDAHATGGVDPAVAVGDGVEAVAAVEQVGAEVADEAVVAGLTVEVVVARAAVQAVVAGAAEEMVRAPSSIESPIESLPPPPWTVSSSFWPSMTSL
jgi:hypothetical protein